MTTVITASLSEAAEMFAETTRAWLAACGDLAEAENRVRACEKAEIDARMRRSRAVDLLTEAATTGQ